MSALWRVSLMDLEGRRTAKTRVVWADLAKAFSILLLVYWTAVGDSLYFNEMLILVRMPLFFFVSGLFAYRVIIQPDWTAFLRDKMGNLLYLYALWIGILFLTTDLVAHVMYDRPIDPVRQLQLFWDPIFTIWFLYALAVAFLVARLVRRVPVWIVMIGAMTLYLATVATGDWRYLPFLERIVRLFPFFWLGLISLPLMASLVERFQRFWLVAIAAFLALAYAVFDSALNAWGPITFAVSMLGIMAMLLLARRLADQSWSRPLTIVGATTLAVYVTHKISLFYLGHGLNAFDIDFPGMDGLMVIPAVVAGALFGLWAPRSPWTAWLLAAPWTLSRRPRPAVLAGAHR